VRCVLIYNPVSGPNRSRRAEQLDRVAEALSVLGHRVELAKTHAAGSAAAQARDAAQNGADAVLACGGDGTVHEVIQGLVSEDGESRTALGILPLGSANALARHLGLSLEPVEAALQQLRGTSVEIPVGKLECGDQVRYFTVMAGAGPDGTLVYKLLTNHKSGLGRLAYYIHAARLVATHRFRPFEVGYTEAASAEVSTVRAVCAMAVRVSNLGGLFGRLTSRSASIDDAHLQLSIVRPPAALSLPLWFVSGWLGLRGLNPLLRRVSVSEFSCRGGPGAGAHVEADGEWLGCLPMRVSLVPGALRMLVPDVRR
jgi:diacylglycerol kinase (ATP)